VTGLKSRPFAGADDLDRYVELLRRVIEADGDGLDFSIDDITAEWIDEEPGWERSLLVWDDGRHMAAAIGVWRERADDQPRAYSSLDIHPESRSPEFIDDVVSALLTLTGDLAGAAVDLRIGCSSGQQWKRDGLERNGFTADRFFHRMTLRLEAPPAPVIVPAGFTIRPIAGVDEADAWVDAFNVGFADHYDAATYTVEEKLAYMERVQYCPGTDLVLIDDVTGVIGVCYCEIERIEGGPPQAWIRSIAIRPEFRGKGLGRLLLNAAIRALYDAGQSQMWLSVDTENGSGALGLYESAGFRPSNLRLVYLKRVKPD
jgi:mycothiol synthase